MAKTTIHVVTAAAAVVRVGSSEQYFYRGANLPDVADKDDVKRLVDIGLVEKVTVEVADSASTGGGAVEAPHANAGEEKWREYATGLGIEVPADADKAKIRELVDEHNKANQA